MIVTDGLPQITCSSSRQERRSGVHGQRMWWTYSPATTSEACSKSGWECGDSFVSSLGPAYGQLRLTISVEQRQIRPSLPTTRGTSTVEIRTRVQWPPGGQGPNGGTLKGSPP